LQVVYDETATNFSKTKKATWLADCPENVPCKLIEFDHLISKAKLEEDEVFQDFVNPVTKKETDGLVDAHLRLLTEGENAGLIYVTFLMVLWFSLFLCLSS
jgi:hypothetical protein